MELVLEGAFDTRRSNFDYSQPEIPAALANLMPKVEIGKDGSQVIRIHQSQITSGQLKALQVRFLGENEMRDYRSI